MVHVIIGLILLFLLKQIHNAHIEYLRMQMIQEFTCILKHNIINIKSLINPLVE
jgi:6-phosphogluconate dehydrogenase